MQEQYGLPLALIIIDTVAAGAGFDDENSAAETQKVMNGLEALSQRTGAFVLGVDHFGKAVETGTRGSSAKEAAADTVLAMLGTKDEAGNVSNLRMAVRKVRGARTGVETPYSLEVVDIGIDQWGEPMSTCVVRWEANAEPAAAVSHDRDAWPAALRPLRRALCNSLAEHGKRVWPFGSESAEVVAVTEVQLRTEFVAAYPTEGATQQQRADAKRKAFKRQLRSAIEKGLIASRQVADVDLLWAAKEA